MKVLICYASTDGHTRKIARRAADRIADRGDAVELLALADAEDVDLRRFDRVVVAASVHLGRYQRALTDFAATQAERLRLVPTLFLSVSLSAAGHEAEDWRGLDRIMEDFEAATGWTPGRVAQVAGAYRPSRYDMFHRFVMRRIVGARAPDIDLDMDREFTDWPALFALIDDWMSAPTA